MNVKNITTYVPTKRFGRRTTLIDAGVGLAVLAAIGGSVWFTAIRQITCHAPGREYAVSLRGDNFSTGHLNAKRCDRLRVSNSGNHTYRLAFGPHDHLIAYPGFSQQQLRPGGQTVITLSKSGEYKLHDHIGNRAYLALTIGN